MTALLDLVVIGGGPAGMAAATTAAGRGLSVALLDENARPGGQVYRAPGAGAAMRGGDAPDPDGERLRAGLAASAARVHSGARVWNAARLDGGFRVDVVDASGARFLWSRRLVLAPGVGERHVPFPGWTTPGVIGLGAATILLKAHGLSPGARVVVAGAGPLLAAVAAGVLAKGAQVVAVVDANRRRDWLSGVPGFASRPDLLLKGLGWVARVVRAGVPWLYGHAVIAAAGGDALVDVTVAPLSEAGAPDRSNARALFCDALAIGHGLVPNVELPRALGAATRYAPELGGWVPVVSADFETSIPDLFVVGDGAGVAGAAAAEAGGRLVAEAIAERTGAGAADALAAARAARDRAARFGAVSARLTQPRPALYRAIPADCVVCRCEDVTRAEIETAMDDGARDMNQLKAFTRAGMGPCQGRSCGEAVAEILAARLGSREAVGQFTARPPFRPVEIAALTGDFAYDDIPIPPPAPL